MRQPQPKLRTGDTRTRNAPGGESGVIEFTEQELDALISEQLMKSEILQRNEDEVPEPHEDSTTSSRAISMILPEPDDFMGATTEEVTVSVAMDSGSVANAIHPVELPSDAQPEPNETGKHFVGANNTRIEKFGTCCTTLEGEHGEVDCDWQLADVTRPLHSLSTIAGPPEGTDKHIEWQERMEQVHNTAEIIVAKQRNGPVGTAKLYFRPEFTRFENLTPDDRLPDVEL